MDCKLPSANSPLLWSESDHFSDITEEDCKAVEKGISKYSAWLHGYDQSAAALAPVPKPEELKVDIEELDNWVKAINKRRGK